MKQFWGLLTVLMIAITFFTYVNAGPPGARGALEIVERELTCIGEKLKDYTLKEGRYPTNDEGLEAIIDPKLNTELGKDIKMYLDMFEEENNEKKSNKDIQFEEAVIQSLRCGWNTKPVHGGIEGWAGVPIMYENRRGLPSNKFFDSPVLKASKAKWWLKVDNDIYVYSIPGMRLWKQIKGSDKTAIFLVCFSFFFFIMFIRSVIIKNDSPFNENIRVVNRLLWAILIIGSLFKLTGGMVIACYPGTVVARRRDREAAQEYSELLDKFHAQGIIRLDTYNKLKEAASEEAFELREKRRRNR